MVPARKAWSSLRSTWPFISEEEGSGEEEGEAPENDGDGGGTFASPPSPARMGSSAPHASPWNAASWTLGSTSLFLVQADGVEVAKHGSSPGSPENESMHDSSSSSGWSSCQPSCSRCSPSCSSVRKPFVTTPGR